MAETTYSPLRHLDCLRMNSEARKETRSRQVYLPPVSVYRWWARRTKTVSDEILRSVEKDFGAPLQVIDPFAGGGVITLAAIARGHRCYAQDINPWACQGLVTSLRLPSRQILMEGLEELKGSVDGILDLAYGTKSVSGIPGVIAHTIRVAESTCLDCGTTQRLFPHAMVSLLKRKEKGDRRSYLACPAGHLFIGDWDTILDCPECGRVVDPSQTYTRGRKVVCPTCGIQRTLSNLCAKRSWRWKVVLVERVIDNERQLAPPTQAEIEKADEEAWNPRTDLGPIPKGRETQVLRRHGFTQWGDLYPNRQKVVTERLLEACRELGNPELRDALRMAIIGTTEMAGFASRWDRWYLKSYETTARHRFSFTTLTVEPNVWGTQVVGRGTLIRRISLFANASEWLTRNLPRRSIVVKGPYAVGASVEEQRPTNASVGQTDDADLIVAQGSSETLLFETGKAHLVLTDPPYHDDILYGELSLPFRAWASLPIETLEHEAVVSTYGNGIDKYRQLLTKIFKECRRVLSPNGHLIFSYSNRSLAAWVALLQSLQDARFLSSGYSIVHSENESDFEKRRTRSCSLDMILDLVPSGQACSRELWCPRETSTEESAELQFLRRIGEYMLKIGNLENGWDRNFVEDLRNQVFVQN